MERALKKFSFTNFHAVQLFWFELQKSIVLFPIEKMEHKSNPAKTKTEHCCFERHIMSANSSKSLGKFFYFAQCQLKNKKFQNCSKEYKTYIFFLETSKPFKNLQSHICSD